MSRVLDKARSAIFQGYEQDSLIVSSSSVRRKDSSPVEKRQVVATFMDSL